MSTPSATLTVWAAAWLAGRTAPDDLLDALHAWAPSQFVVAGDPVTADRIGIAADAAVPDNGVTTLLRALRTATAGPGSQFRLLLPIPGDVRGIPAGTAFAADVVAAGEGVLVGVPGSEGIGLVPQWIDPDTAAIDPTDVSAAYDCGDRLGWTVHSAPVPMVSGLEQTLGEAEYSMREAVREAAEAMAQLRGVFTGGPGPDPRALVEAELAAYARHQYPESTPLRARRVLDTADHVAAILTVAQREPSFTPASATGARAQEDLFRPLWDAIRAARLVAVRSAVQDAA